MRPARFAPLLAALPLLSACADERPPINRVQPMAIAKSFFLGDDLVAPGDDPEFYLRTTLVDVQAGAGADGLFTSSDSQPTSRIRWEVTEDLLLARLTYELVESTDGKGLSPTPDGQLVAAFAIQKHFDIIRDYNPATGEELNVVVENDTDRPWNERGYLRVDWSRNLVTDAYDLDAASQLGIWYGVKWDPIAYEVNDPNHPDAPVFAVDEGYFDLTLKAWADPDVIHDPEWGDFPACWLVGEFPTLSCNPSEVTMRLSFKRVGDTDYEPLSWDGTRMDMFGYFTDDRFGYERRYGVVDDRWHRFAARWNVWERSHVDPPVPCNEPDTTPVGADPHRDDDGDGTEDECAAVGRGSRCDEFVGLCTIPYRDRAVKPVVWHTSPAFPEDLFPGTAAAMEAWNDAMRVAVLAARLAECRRTGETGCEATHGWPADWADDYEPPVGTGPAEVPEVFVFCHNPVDPAKGDAPACGEAGLAPRLGDLRFNLVTFVESPQVTRPWGIMVDAEDPLTGEKISGSVNEWGATLDRAASSLVDVVGLLTGVIDPEAYIAGQDVSGWVAANHGGAQQKNLAMSADELHARKGAFDPHVLEPYLSGMPAPDPKEPPGKRHAARLKALIESGRLGPGNGALTARLHHLRGTGLEAALVTPELAQAAGYDPTGPVSAEVVKRASPFWSKNPAVRKERERARRLARADRHSCKLEGLEPDVLLGLAGAAQKLFPLPDPSDPAAVHDWEQQLYQWARQQYSQGVMAHEIGHSMGLRHNFAASFDAMSYREGYWQLRTKNGTLTADCPDGTTDGEDCVAPRWRDPLAQYEIDGNIGQYATSSVMDYPGDPNQDTLVAGKYDRAALRLGYGGVVDVYAAPGLSVDGAGALQQQAYDLTAFATSPGLFGVYYFPDVDPANGYRFFHYSKYQERFGLIRDCAASGDPDAVLGEKCKGPALDVVDYRDMSDFASDPDYAAYSWAVAPRAVDPGGRVRRGYMFSSDEFADTGNVPSFTLDAGADAYEQVRFLESLYENRYLLENFRRNRTQFNSWDTTARVQGRYLDTIQQIAKTFAFGAILDGDPTAPSAGFLDDGYYGPLGVGFSVAFDLFARTLVRPEPGYFCPAGICGSPVPWGVEDEVFAADTAALPDVYVYDFRLPVGEGRYLHNDFDYSQGYYWSDYQMQVGSYYEKIWAVYYLAEAFDSFISNSKEDFVDSRYKNVNFATIYPEQTRRLYNALLTDDLATYAPWTIVPANPSDTPDGVVRYPSFFEPDLSAARPNAALLVDPTWGWNPRAYAMVWGTMFFTTNWSNHFVDEARIVSNAQDAPWPAAETFAFFDPSTGLTFYAHTTGTEVVFGQARQRSAGARMLEWANRLATYAYLVDRDVNGDPIYGPDGLPTFQLDGNGKVQKDPANPGADAALAKFVDSVQMMEQLAATFLQPVDWLPEP